MSDDQQWTAAGARDLLDRTEAETESALDVPTGPLLAVWGAALTAGHLAIWWATREQDPYTGPPGWALAVLGGALALALVLTVVTVGRAARGVHGLSSRAGLLYSLTWVLSFGAAQAIMVALARDGIPDATFGKLSALIPLLLVATIYLASAAPLGAPALAVVGGLLAGTVATAAWFDPSPMALVIAVGCAIPFGAGVAATRRPR